MMTPEGATQRYGSALDGIDQYLGQIAAGAEQTATADATAADHNTPGPQEQVPGVEQSFTPEQGGQIAPPAGQPPAAPAPAATPAQPIDFSGVGQAPPPAESVSHEAQRGMTPGGFAQEATQAARDEQRMVETGMAQQKQGMADELKAVQQANIDAADSAREMAAARQEREAAMLETQNKAEAAQKAIEAETRQHIDALAAEAASNPQDWFAHHSTSQKIGAVLGMIGAGWSGGSAIGYMEDLVNQDVAASNRRSHAHSQAIDELGKLSGLQRQRFGDLDTRGDARAAVTYKRITDMLEAKKASTANPIAKARYDQAIGELQIKQADIQGKINGQKFTHWATAQQQAVQQAQLRQNEELAMMRMENAALKQGREEGKDFVQFNDYEGSRGVRTGSGGAKMGEEHRARVNVLTGLQGLADNMAKLGDQGVIKTESQRKQVVAMFQPDIRKIQGAGAALSGDEKATMDALTPSWDDYIKGKISDNDFADQIKFIQRSFAHQDMTAFNSANEGGHAVPRSDSAVGRVLSTERADSEREQAERPAVETALKLPTPAQQHAKLNVLAMNGNLTAKKALKKWNEQFSATPQKDHFAGRSPY